MFFEFSLTNVLLVGILAVLLADRRKPVLKWLHARKMERKLGMILRTVRIYWNEHNGVVVIAREDDYLRAADAHAERVNRGEVKPWERMEFRAIPAFTFFVDEERRNFMHVGDNADLKGLAYQLLKACTFGHVTSADIDEMVEHFGKEKVLGTIARKSPHLFVPYASGNFAEQAKAFPKYELDNVRDYLLKKRALPPVNPIAA